MSESNNIHLFFNDNDSEEDAKSELAELDLSMILKEMNNVESEYESQTNDMNAFTALSVYYEINYNVKQLLTICDYYKIAKELRSNKNNKTEIIYSLVLFENNEDNFEIVLRRKQLWFYINELKNDKFMKKYVLWN